MDKEFLIRCRDTYRDGLLDDTLPFWFPAAIDESCGGFLTGLGRDGTVIHPDKSVWFQGRTTWTLANLYNTVEKRPQWLQYAKHGIDFLEKHCFDQDGRMFFSLTREGRPLQKRRYWFSESFAAIAFAAYGNASGDETYIEKAMRLFEKIVFYHQTPGALPAKIDPAVRPMKGLSPLMILLVTAQELRRFRPGEKEKLDTMISEWIREIREDFMKSESRCTLECVGPDGLFYDTFEGRMINPGHSLELGWFVLHEAKYRDNDPELIALGKTIVDWAFQWGWDEKYGGIYYFRDCKNLPTWEYWSDMKFWWPHNETIIATLLAYQMTGDDSYLEKHKMVHQWSYEHFPDPEFGEWFGYLHRDGSVSTELKGNMWKGPFHLPRMQWYCWKLLEEILA